MTTGDMESDAIKSVVTNFAGLLPAKAAAIITPKIFEYCAADLLRFGLQ